MATINNPNNAVGQVALLNACEGLLVTYASSVLVEPKFANIGGSGLFTQYNKRQDFARKCLLIPSMYAPTLAILCEIIESNILFNTIQNNIDIYRYLYDGNPTGRPITEALVAINSFTSVGNTSGISVFDTMSGISNADTL